MNTDEHRSDRNAAKPVFIGVYLWFIPLSVIAVAFIGFAMCRALGFDPHVRETIFGSASCLIAAELAMVPLLLTRGAGQPAVAQAGLVSTIVHMFASAALGGGAMLAGSLALHRSLVYWLMAQYWLTLIVVVVAVIKAVRSAPIGTPTNSQTTPTLSAGLTR